MTFKISTTRSILGSTLIVLPLLMSCSNPPSANYTINTKAGDVEGANPDYGSSNSTADTSNSYPNGTDTSTTVGSNSGTTSGNGQTNAGSNSNTGTTVGMNSGANTGTTAGNNGNTNSGTNTGTAAMDANDGNPKVGSMDKDGWKLVWSEEFSAAKIDEKTWNYEIWKPGKVNNEKQGYTNRSENSRIEDGHLVIEARHDNYQGQEYTSARLTTQKKAFWTYGKVEARIKMTAAKGTWPAFWMMPEDQSNGWPNCGEMDIMEEVGFDKDVVHGTTHVQNFFGANGRGGPKTVPNLTNDYHVYGIEWYADHIDWFVDGVKYFSQQKTGGDEVYPFHKNFHIILNLAIGGDWGGQQGIDGNMPNQQMLVDYVRVWQK